MLMGVLSICCTQKQLEEEKGARGEETSVDGPISSISKQLKRGAKVIVGSKDRKGRMGVGYKALKVLMGRLKKCELRGFIVKTRKLL